MPYNEPQMALLADRQPEGRTRRVAAVRDYELARDAADDIDMCLYRVSKVQFQLCDGKAVWDLFPGTQRVVAVGHKVLLKLPAPWTLLDVVRAAYLRPK